MEKSYELRLTVIGQHLFGAKLYSQKTSSGRLDWRKAYHELKMGPYDIPPSIAKLCLALMERLGIVFGCFDFIKTQGNEYVFLEVNQMGQFLFVERYTQQPLLAAFCEMLHQGTPDFRWRENKTMIRYSDLFEFCDEAVARACRSHIKLSFKTWEEGKTTTNPTIEWPSIVPTGLCDQ